MTDATTQKDILDWQADGKKMPSMLNVLTILTFIGCGLGICGAIYSFTSAQANYDKILAMQDKLDQVPGFLKNMMGKDPVGNSLKMLNNRTPLLLMNLLGYGLCLYGAIAMRKLKKMGYSVYVIGQIVPFLALYLFLGGIEFGFAMIFGLLLVGIFLILYGTQLKYMK